jgi:hypothetical protein
MFTFQRMADSSAHGAVGKAVPQSTQPGQNLNFEEESVVSVGLNAYSVEVEAVCGSTVSDALAEEHCLVPRELQMTHHIAGKIGP